MHLISSFVVGDTRFDSSWFLLFEIDVLCRVVSVSNLNACSINWSGKCRKIQNENNAIYLSFFLFHYRETFVFQHVSVSSAPTIAWSAAFICSQFDLFASLHFEWNALNNSTWPSDIDDIINKILRCLLILLRFCLSNYRASTFMWFVSSFYLVVVLFSFLIVAQKR